MTLSQRISYFEQLIFDLQETNSIVEKRRIVNDIPTELTYDFEQIIHCLNGGIKFGYTYNDEYRDYGDRVNENCTIADCIEFLLQPLKMHDLSRDNIGKYVSKTYNHAWFFEPIVNRELKLGIGKSLFAATDISAMLAKKYEGFARDCKGGFYITEKLDGNRCIAHHNGLQWVFTSRNGKPMHVNFDMTGLPKEFIYDGEVLSPEQVKMSEAIYNKVVWNDAPNEEYVSTFNTTSGLINRHTLDKKLIYNIFDIVLEEVPYKSRREALDKLKLKVSDDVRILPVLCRYTDNTEMSNDIHLLLDVVTKMGGEGLMINTATGNYLHKRTDQLLKYKPVGTMDMEVIGIEPGHGKYEGMVGALNVRCIQQDGTEIQCQVGSGLSDVQRIMWAINPMTILGKIVEVAYFSLSQSRDRCGQNIYSLRFPRLKKVREDKFETSEF